MLSPTSPKRFVLLLLAILNGTERLGLLVGQPEFVAVRKAGRHG